MNKFNQAGTPAATPTTTSEKDLLVAAYQALDTERRAQLLSYAQYLVDQSQTTTEQRVKAMEFNQALAKAAAGNQEVFFK